MTTITSSPFNFGRNDLAASILERIARGDSEAVKECLDVYGGLVWSLARQLSRTPADAEDTVQEVFIDLWQNAHRYDATIASEATFITTIARRRLIDRLRRQERNRIPVPLEDNLVALPDPGLAQVELGDEAARVAEHFAGLRPEEQHVLRLSLTLGLSYPEIATRMNFPLSTVKTHARRGLRRLRSLLNLGEDDVGPDPG